MTATMIKALPNSPLFRAFWGSPPSFTETMKVPIIETMIPDAAMSRGSNTKLRS